MARVAKMRGAEAKENSDGAAVTAFVLQEVCSVLRTHLGSGDVRASAANKLGGVVIRVHACLQVAPSLTAVISLVTLEANVIGVAVHGITCRVRMETSPFRRYGFALVQTLVFEAHESLSLNVVKEKADGRE